MPTHLRRASECIRNTQLGNGGGGKWYGAFYLENTPDEEKADFVKGEEAMHDKARRKRIAFGGIGRVALSRIFPWRSYERAQTRKRFLTKLRGSEEGLEAGLPRTRSPGLLVKKATKGCA